MTESNTHERKNDRSRLVPETMPIMKKMRKAEEREREMQAQPGFAHTSPRKTGFKGRKPNGQILGPHLSSQGALNKLIQFLDQVTKRAPQSLLVLLKKGKFIKQIN